MSRRYNYGFNTLGHHSPASRGGECTRGSNGAVCITPEGELIDWNQVEGNRSQEYEDDFDYGNRSEEFDDFDYGNRSEDYETRPSQYQYQNPSYLYDRPRESYGLNRSRDFYTPSQTPTLGGKQTDLWNLISADSANRSAGYGK